MGWKKDSQNQRLSPHLAGSHEMKLSVERLWRVGGGLCLRVKMKINLVLVSPSRDTDSFFSVFLKHACRLGLKSLYTSVATSTRGLISCCHLLLAAGCGILNFLPGFPTTAS